MNTGYRIILQPGSFSVKRQGLNQPGHDLERALIDFALSKGLAHNPSGDCCTIVKKVRITQDLVSGNNTITHNMNLASPYWTIVEVRSSTGALITSSVSQETANTLVVNVGANATNAQITII